MMDCSSRGKGSGDSIAIVQEGKDEGLAQGGRNVWTGIYCDCVADRTC